MPAAPVALEVLAVGLAFGLFEFLAQAEDVIFELSDADIEPQDLAIALAELGLQPVDVLLSLGAARTVAVGEFHGNSAWFGFRIVGC